MDVSVLLSILALSISAVSLVISAFAAIYTRRQAIAAEDAARIEKDRRQEEIDLAAQQLEARQRADVTAQLSKADGQHLIGVKNAGPADAEILLVTCVQTMGSYAPNVDAWRSLTGPLPAGKGRFIKTRLSETGFLFKVATEWQDGNGTHRSETWLRAYS